ncbi:hypothetical protein KKD52_18440 [Myxococcota bacterium]|nr:hypothetical protein [Myxococcota bacterium]MBU1410935.1 hypothetical protein [Myxococcota bacterium]MBU1512335.1 hypothetical protein [Myxococcota bacterium]
MLALSFLAFIALSCNPKGSEKPTSQPSPSVDMPPPSPKVDMPPPAMEAPVVEPPAAVPAPTPEVTDPELDAPGGLKADLACTRDDECTFAPPHPCACDTCPARLAKASNKKSAQERLDFYARARFDCEPCRGPVCKPLGTSVVCKDGQCTVLE